MKWSDAARVLELDPRDVPPDLTALKRLVRKQYRCLVKRHHPDQGGSLQRMQEINRVVEAIEACTDLRLTRRPVGLAPPVVIRSRGSTDAADIHVWVSWP